MRRDVYAAAPSYPMNLSFRIGKVPVRILPSFFIVTAMLSLGTTSLSELVVWVGVVLGSVLVHELGHAAVARASGLEPQIQLHGMGGTTSWTSARPLPVARRVAISLAGPLAGFVVAAIVRWAIPPLWFASETGMRLREDLLYVNFRWGVLNLLPMLPLDGGNVMTELLNAATRGRGERPARVVSIVVASAAALAALVSQWWWAGLVAGSFVASNWRGLKDLRAAEHDLPLRQALRQARAALETKSAARVVELARPVALQSRTAPVRAEALQLLAFGLLLEGRVADADAAIAAIPQGFTVASSLLALRDEIARPGPPGEGRAKVD